MSHHGRRQRRAEGIQPTFKGTNIAGLNYHIPDGFPAGPHGEVYIRILPQQRWVWVSEDDAKPKEKSDGQTKKEG